MISDTQKRLLDALREVLDFTDTDMRIGQLVFNLGWMGEALVGSPLREIEDDQLLAVIERHRADLLRTGRTLTTPSSDSQPLLMEHI